MSVEQLVVRYLQDFLSFFWRNDLQLSLLAPLSSRMALLRRLPTLSLLLLLLFSVSVLIGVSAYEALPFPSSSHVQVTKWRATNLQTAPPPSPAPPPPPGLHVSHFQNQRPARNVVDIITLDAAATNSQTPVDLMHAKLDELNALVSQAHEYCHRQDLRSLLHISGSVVCTNGESSSAASSSTSTSTDVDGKKWMLVRVHVRFDMDRDDMVRFRWGDDSPGREDVSLRVQVGSFAVASTPQHRPERKVATTLPSGAMVWKGQLVAGQHSLYAFAVMPW